MVPAYFNDDGSWRAMAQADRVGVVVLNPDTGAGKRRSAAVARQVQSLQASGAKVVGYVKTGLGARPSRQVKAEIKKYARWYRVDGIFLDEVHNLSRVIPYYRSLAGVIRRTTGNGGEDGFVALNPGYVPAKGYMKFADLVTVYEYYYSRYPSQKFPAWIYDYPADRFAHVIFNVPNSTAALETTLALARQRNAGYVFVTNLRNPRQYRALPGFWSAHLSALCR